MTANAEIILEAKKNVLLVPESAVKASLEVPDAGTEKGRRAAPRSWGFRMG